MTLLNVVGKIYTAITRLNNYTGAFEKQGTS